MSRSLMFLFAATALFLLTDSAFAQKKYCSKCKNEVAPTAGTGGSCPHCGAKWSYDATGTSSNSPLGYGTGKAPAPPPSASSSSKAPGYHWRPIKGSDDMALYMGDRRVGEYNPKEKIYRKYDEKGKLSEPTTPPWESGNAKSDGDKEKSKSTEKAEVPKEKPKADAEADDGEPKPLPPWAPYAGGGAVAVVAIVIGLLFRR